ncbi:ABC transporter substrate-binding protein [Brevibacterium luteolum]|uniref:ABC transporter substrate-binding protein n=1 Tax=Brevibacterium luteolum TaxID=199591 RepID=UPI00223B9495|nr:ABC transporter substrate-binding protein [Brevibacterium luteolum]MCT1829758.1 ABC transporter substrate-binding protein [Brevibacterium luteolum]
MFKNRKTVIAAVSSAATLAIVLSACGESGASGGSDEKVVLGFPGGLGPTDVPAVKALEVMKDEGWDTDYIEFDSPDVQTQALISGDTNLASMGPATVMAADVQGGSMKMVGENNSNDLLIVTAGDVNECSELDGKPVAYHSEGSTSTAHLRAWIDDQCSGTEPQWMVISGSGNRTAALVDGQIAGTIVRTEDWVAGTEGTNTDAHVLDELSATQSDLLTQTIVTTEENTDSEATDKFLEELDKQFQAVNEDPETYAEGAADLLPNIENDTLTNIYASLVEQNVFPESHELSKDKVDATISFYEDSETIPRGEVSSEDVAKL